LLNAEYRAFLNIWNITIYLMPER